MRGKLDKREGKGRDGTDDRWKGRGVRGREMRGRVFREKR